MSDLARWCAGWHRPPHVPDDPPVPIEGTTARLCSVCDRQRREVDRG